MIFQTSMIMFHVNLPGCNLFTLFTATWKKVNQSTCSSKALAGLDINGDAPRYNPVNKKRKKSPTKTKQIQGLH